MLKLSFFYCCEAWKVSVICDHELQVFVNNR